MARTPEQELLLALTAIRSRRLIQRASIEGLLRRCKQPALLELLHEHGVLALHGARAQESAPGAAPWLERPASLAAQVTAQRALVLEAVLEDVLGLLGDAGVPALPIKGPRLARAAHGDPGLRPSVDLDVLVAPARLRAAEAALAAAGYGTAGDRLRADGYPELHLTMVHPEPWGPRVEVHWRVHWADEGHGTTITDRAEAIGGGELRALPADELAILLLCHARDGFVGVRLASDIAGWWDAQGEAVGPGALDALAAAHPDLTPALATAALAVDAVTGTAVAGTLSPEHLGRHSARALRMVDPLAAGDPQQLRAQTALVEWALLPPGQARAFARRRVEFATRAERRLDRALHIPKLAGRYVLAAARPPEPQLLPQGGPPLPVSVVIPAFRRTDTIAAAVASALSQSSPPAEVIVVDDASGDATAEVAREAGARVVVHEHNLGEGGARNTGVAAATQPWVAFLDSDDEWLPWHLERLWALRDGHVLVGAACVAVGEGLMAGRVLGWRGPRPRVMRRPPEIAWPENVITPSGAMARRDAVLVCGGFAVGMKQGADLDTWLRLLEHGSALASPHVGVRYHLHAAQISADRRAMHDARMRLYGAYRDRPWYDARVLQRMAAVDAWDLRDPRMLAATLRRPAGVAALGATWLHRRRKRRANRERRAALQAAGVSLDR
ncbi:MAG: glycosyltransferase [Solirubrobacteraceae bacterium]